jgi:membrane protein
MAIDHHRPTDSPPDDGHGSQAERPTDVPAAGWKDVLFRVKGQMRDDDISLLSAGVAFYALLALVPGLVALVSVYGLVADPTQVERQVGDLLGAAPTEVRELVQTQLQDITTGSRGGASLGIAIGIVTALWSASSGMKHLIGAVNRAYGEPEGRGFVRLQAVSLALTLGAIGFLAVAFGLVALLPAALSGTGLGGPTRTVLNVLRFPLLGVGLIVGLAVLYRFAPDRAEPRWTWVSVGAVSASVLWIVASVLFSVYAANFGKYNETYGSLGTVVVVMLWLYLTAYVVIAGAELNAELEHQTARDSTTGRPEEMGRRGAVMADTVAEREPGKGARHGGGPFRRRSTTSS